MFSRKTSVLTLVLGAAATGIFIATAPTAAACDPGWYPTDTTGVCTDMPPEMRPAHAPRNPVLLPGDAAIVDGILGGSTPADSDGDGKIDSIDALPFDPKWY